MIWAAGHLFLATVLAGQSEVVLLSANYGAILYNGINKLPKMVPMKKIKVVGSFDLSACRDGHLPCNFVHQSYLYGNREL